MSVATIGAETPPNILVVDDDEPSARLLTQLLRMGGFKAFGAPDAEVALAMARMHSFDLVMSDLCMPGKDGWTMMREMRERRPIPGIAISAHTTPEDRARSEAAGYLVHLPKPIDIHDVIEAVHGVLAAARSRRPS